MFDRSPARFVAPLALAGAVVAIVLVVKGAHPRSSSSATSTTTTTTTPVRPHHHHRPRHRFYVVKPGDVLSAIAQRYGLTTREIQELNPNLDPQALQAGQRVRLR